MNGLFCYNTNNFSTLKQSCEDAHREIEELLQKDLNKGDPAVNRDLIDRYLNAYESAIQQLQLFEQSLRGSGCSDAGVKAVTSGQGHAYYTTKLNGTEAKKGKDGLRFRITMRRPYVQKSLLDQIFELLRSIFQWMTSSKDETL